MISQWGEIMGVADEAHKRMGKERGWEEKSQSEGKLGGKEVKTNEQ